MPADSLAWAAQGARAENLAGFELLALAKRLGKPLATAIEQVPDCSDSPRTGLGIDAVKRKLGPVTAHHGARRI